MSISERIILVSAGAIAAIGSVYVLCNSVRWYCEFTIWVGRMFGVIPM